jgi:hypothetical protein
MEDETLLIEIVAYAPTAFYHCKHCEFVWQQSIFGKGLREKETADTLPPEPMRGYQALSDWVQNLFKIYSNRIIIKVIDVASIEGFWKSLRLRLRRYPAVVVGGKVLSTGTDFTHAEAEISRRLTSVPA